jgi:hypothetical protein
MATLGFSSRTGRAPDLHSPRMSRQKDCRHFTLFDGLLYAFYTSGGVSLLLESDLRQNRFLLYFNDLQHLES